MKRFRALVRPALVLAAALSLAQTAGAQIVRFASKPTGLVAGKLPVTVVATEPVAQLELRVNGVRHGAMVGRALQTDVEVGYYIRRLRLRAVGFDADGKVVGEDEMVVNDPRPPFRVRLQGPPAWPASGTVELQANVLRPAEVWVSSVDFYVGEEKVASDDAAPYVAPVDAARFPGAVYARAVARSGVKEANEQEANDVLFFGDPVHATEDVTLQQIPVSVVGSTAPLRAEQLTVLDGATPRRIEGLVPAGDQPLYVMLLIDYSESMLEELPVVKAAAEQFARELLRPQDRIAVVGFNQRTFWMTAWTNNWDSVGAVLGRVKPAGETHLYDSVIEMLYQLQKMPGRQALVVLTDGADQGSRFELDHVVHYARYAGVPIYPVIKNKVLSRWMKLGIGRLGARRVARLAEETGATYFIVQREAELPAVYARIAKDLRQQYQLVFHSETDLDDRWHPLRIESTAGLKLRAPKGYFP